MQFLIEAASAMNPIQFELPREMTLPNMTFPGADKGKFGNKYNNSRLRYSQNSIM